MGEVEYRENRAGIEAMLSAPWMVEGLRRDCEPIKAQAEVNTPVDTGRMKASWRIWAGVRDRRARVQIYNIATSEQGFHYPWLIEKGGARIQAQHPLGRALGRFGQS